MGCFSFKCKVCGDALNSDSFSGEHCTLYLLDDGVVVEKMSGQYDSYGRVFDEHGQSVEWRSHSWDGVCDLMFSKNKGDGIAVVHSDCNNGVIPNTRSEDDINQGWGEYKHSTDEGIH